MQKKRWQNNIAISFRYIIKYNYLWYKGNPTPSVEDKNITARLVEAGRALGVNVLDHIITGRSSYYSFKEQNEFSLVGEFETSYGNIVKEKPSLAEKIDKAKDKAKEVNKDKPADIKREVERN